MELELAYAIDAYGERMRLYIGAYTNIRGPRPGSALIQRIKRVIIPKRSKAMTQVTAVTGRLVIVSIGWAYGTTKG